MLAKRKITCKEAKNSDINDFMKHCGHKPAKEKENETWYLSPFRQEKDPSFRINNSLQLWYDYGIGQGGDIIKLGCLLFSCDVAGFLERLERENFSFSQQERTKIVETKSKIISIETLSDPLLIKYIEERAISKEIAKEYCKQVNYSVGSNQFKSIGFPNRSGGWELRSKNFKGATSKDLSLILRNSNIICVFEGFFDLLSYIQLKPEESKTQDLLSMNSLALLDKSCEVLINYKEIRLFLDNDESGKVASGKLLGMQLSLVIDNSKQYSAHKDLNEHLVVTKARLMEMDKAHHQENVNRLNRGGLSM